VGYAAGGPIGSGSLNLAVSARLPSGSLLTLEQISMSNQTPEERIGNQHGLLCPQCKKGDNLKVAAIVVVKLCPDGTDNTDSDTEWDSDSCAQCDGCDWFGHVRDFEVAAEFTEEEGLTQ
jgi:hypothetical protein